MQMQKRKLRYILGIILFLFSATLRVVAQEKDPLMIQYKNFVCLGNFPGLPAMPEGYVPLNLTQQSADSALRKFSDFLLSRATTDENIRKIVFGLERYYIQMARIHNDKENLVLFNAYKEEHRPPEGPSKSWLSAEGGGVDFWGGTIDEKSGKITFFVNDPF